jgi:RNA polymerase I-specific transcription initiation factor RRN3
VEFLHVAEDMNLFVDCDNADDIVEDKKELAMKFIEHLWISSSAKQSKQMPRVPNKIKPINLKRRKSIIISTAATQEKKRLDGGVGGLGQGSNPLDSFFPFDPYLLQQSYIHVHSYYRNWEDCILSIDDVTESNSHREESLVDENSGSDISVPDDEGEDAVDEDEEGSVDDEDVADDVSQGSRPSQSVDQVPTSTGVTSLYEDSRFEMEIGRSRAMSTGSQCSW